MTMAETALRWLMSAVGKPLEKAGFDPFPPSDGEVVVAVAGCGVCHTDLGFWKDGVRTNHPLPLTLGHEISGRVTAVGAGAESWNGRAVIVPSVIPCGECALCRSGRGTICRKQQMPGNDIHGGFATHVRVPARGLCPVDEDRLAAVELSLADVSVIADAVTTPYQAAIQAEVRPGDFAVVVGVGGVGGYAVQVARAFGATVAALDVDPEKLEKISSYGASLALDVRQVRGKELRAAIRDFVKANGLPSAGWKIFECSGTAAGQETAFGLLNHGATLGVVGFTMEKVELRLSNLMAFHARALGNWGCLPELYPGALDLVLEGKVKIGPFVERHPLDEINRVFDDACAHRLARRAVLVPGPP